MRTTWRKMGKGGVNGEIYRESGSNTSTSLGRLSILYCFSGSAVWTAQTLIWPYSCMYLPVMSMIARARTFLCKCSLSFCIVHRHRVYLFGHVILMIIECDNWSQTAQIQIPAPLFPTSSLTLATQSISLSLSFFISNTSRLIEKIKWVYIHTALLRGPIK